MKDDGVTNIPLLEQCTSLGASPAAPRTSRTPSYAPIGRGRTITEIDADPSSCPVLGSGW